MQIALISDIHSNLEALDAVLADIDSRAPGAKIVCAGDIVGYGPDPSECIQRLISRAIMSVMGNHDEMVLGQRDFSRCIYAGIQAARWTRKVLSLAELKYLQQLPDVVPVTPNVVACHGTPENADIYISNDSASEMALGQLRERFSEADTLVCGHTHHAAVYSKTSGFRRMESGAEFAIPAQSLCVINPGAVGQSRDGKSMARYAILDTESRIVSFLGLTYDHATTVNKLRRVRLSPVVDLQRPTGLTKYMQAIKRRLAQFWYKSNPRLT